MFLNKAYCEMKTSYVDRGTKIDKKAYDYYPFGCKNISCEDKKCIAVYNNNVD